MTKVEAIINVLKDNNGIANWNIIYNEIEKYYPDAKKSAEWQAGIRGVLYREIKNGKSFKRIDEGTFALTDYDEKNLVLKDELEMFDTSRNVVMAMRIGQEKYRSKLLMKIKKCPFTDISDTRLLISSHIKPWSQSNNYERLDTNNGFVFTPTFDKLFDRGLISFDNEKHLIISNSMNIETRKKLNIFSNMIVKSLPIKGREEYLEYHRSKILLI